MICHHCYLFLATMLLYSVDIIDLIPRLLVADECFTHLGSQQLSAKLVVNNLHLKSNFSFPRWGSDSCQLHTLLFSQMFSFGGPTGDTDQNIPQRSAAKSGVHTGAFHPLPSSRQPPPPPPPPSPPLTCQEHCDFERKIKQEKRPLVCSFSASAIN